MTGLVRSRWHAAALTGIASGLLLATTLAPTAVADGADGADGLRAAPQSEQPRPVGTTRTTKRAARANSIGKSPATLTAGAPAPAPASCVNVAVAPGQSPAGGYLPLSLFGVPAVGGVGDETMTNFNVPAFDYNGITYTQFGISSNGYVQMAPTTASEFINTNFPAAAAPNGVLAPFWTDLNPSAGGAIRIGTLTDGIDTWIVVDWEAVREFSQFRVDSFQIWIGINGDGNSGEDISFAYGTIQGNGDLGFLTVGAENNTGSAGSASYFNGTGTLPGNGTQLRVTSGGGGPIADFTASPSQGDAPLHVDFDATASRDDVSIAAYDWAFGDGNSGSGATVSNDYAPGIHTATLTVTDGDGNTCSGTRTITSNGAFSVNDVTVNESAGTATFTVSRLGGGTAVVDVSATPGSAGTPADFTASPQTLVFDPGELSETYQVTIAQDSLDEFTETYAVQLSNASAGGIADGTGRGFITDDDALVRISVNDVNITEGDSGTRNLNFRVRLNRASGKTVRVRAQTADGSARAPGDYVTKTVTLTFLPGQTGKTVSVAVRGDVRPEPNETLFLLLDMAVNATLADPSGTGGIINND